MLFQILSYIILIISFLVGFFKRKKIKNSTEYYFLMYLSFVVIYQILELIHRLYIKTPTYIYFNIYDIVTFLFFIFWFYKVLESKKIVYMLGVLYLISLMVSINLESFLQSYLDINTISGTIMILIFVIIFYSILLKKQEIIVFLNNPKFWIATGLMIFYIGYLPVLILLNLKSFEESSVNLFVLILNLVMYSCFIKAFLCYK